MSNLAKDRDAFFQSKVNRIIPPELQRQYKEAIDHMKAGFYWGIEFVHEQVSNHELVREETTDIKAAKGTVL